ncbi:ArdC-like ssDNA-binding domain-containing protein [Bradyrhizobium sp. NBAIM01]|uniref:ArdC-like ssDNA-binding domain-containing protein n=1 Tax=Bradyrhizobium sp. NBAIM01 TaxID=2793818 RepID=UPI001CD3D794|nr:ArdC-like ssDNA-binding domain-containing protein [Bradyrhizobium sp. NBAIM01]MCA1515631.1 DUF1738 domain-containing protein [Bradyrhizobium sp. NBAIM01]
MTKAQAHPRRDVYQTITDQIIEELERGVRPWRQPWSADHMAGRVVLPLRHNGVPYRGVNVVALWIIWPRTPQLTLASSGSSRRLTFSLRSRSYLVLCGEVSMVSDKARSCSRKPTI